MDFTASEASAEEVGAEFNEHLICIMCHECGFQMWAAVRDNVPTEVRCFRVSCVGVTEVTIHLSHEQSAPESGEREK